MDAAKKMNDSFPQITLEQLEVLKRKLLKEHGFDLSFYSPGYAQRRINACLMKKGCGFSEYLHLLEVDTEEFGKFLDTFTINVTEFFRDPPVWNVLEETVLPQVLREKLEVRGQKSEIYSPQSIVHRPQPSNLPIPLRIWSAGCASGEEPYSIAVMVKEAIENITKDRDRETRQRVAIESRLISVPVSISTPNFLITIFATDIDEASLEKAQNGIYSKDNLKNVNPYLLQKYFVPVIAGKSEAILSLESGLPRDFVSRNDNKSPNRSIAQSLNYKISNEIKKMVTFKKHHFFNDKPFTSLDIIFCRNATIYLTAEMKDHLLETFYKSLNHHAYLIIGKSETIFSKARYCFYPVDAKEHIFRKERRTAQAVHSPHSTNSGLPTEKRKNFWGM